MHYNGITNHFIVYIVHDFLGNHRSIASFTAWKCNQSKLILAGELRWWKMYKMNTLLLEVLLAIVIWYFARYFSWTLKNNKNDHNVIKTIIMMKDYTMKYEQAMQYNHLQQLGNSCENNFRQFLIDYLFFNTRYSNKHVFWENMFC